MNADLHFKLFTVLLTNTDIGPRIGIHPLHHSHNPLLHTKFSQRPPDDLLRYSIRGLEQKPCRVSCWQLATSLAAAFVQRLHLLCLCLGYSQTGNHRLTPTVWGGPQSYPGLSWPALSALDHVGFPFSMHLLCLCLGQSQTGNRRLTPSDEAVHSPLQDFHDLLFQL